MPSTGILFDPKAGVAGALDGNTAMPRSIASDGSTMKLIGHVLVHVIALSLHIAATVMMFIDFPQTLIKTGVIISVVMHCIGILGVLALAAFAVKQIAYTFALGAVYSFLLSGFAGSVAMAVFNYRTDDVLTSQHWLYYAAIYSQALGLGLVLSNSLNMAANGDKAMPKDASKAETAPLASSA